MITAFVLVKDQIKSKRIFSSRRFLIKKPMNKFYFTTIKPQVDSFLFGFWRKLKTTPNRHFEINWPLVGEPQKLKVCFWVGIFPRTFPIFKSRDFWTSLAPGQQDHGTFKVSRSCPVLSRDLGPLVPGLPGTSRDLFGRLFEKKNQFKDICFSIFAKFFLAKLLIFDCEL